jgi:hypothetical protein
MHPVRRLNIVGIFGLQSRSGLLAQPAIDRQALVLRHTVHIDKPDPLSALSVGNGRFAFTVDITGLQTFPEFYDHGIPLGTESEWGWHSFVDTSSYRRDEASKTYHIHGRDIPYIVQWSRPKRNKDAADWFRQNPHRLQLGNIGLELIKRNGQAASIGDIANIHQELNIWTGELGSTFTVEGTPVEVSTLVHPDLDLVAVRIRSSLIERGRIRVRLRFPYPTGTWADAGDDWQDPGHRSLVVGRGSSHARVEHILDSTRYFADWTWSGPGGLKQTKRHEFMLTPAHNRGNDFSFTCLFSPEESGQSSPSWFLTRHATAEAWKAFWTSGAAVDLSGSTDTRAPELERRIVLSQYLTRIQSAGDYPPQETGLTYNSWFGKPHLEMHWWHEAHFALWGRPGLLERSLAWYRQVAPKARRIAERQGYAGIRWQKMTDTAGEESPSSVGAFLIWQQPHIIYLAELCYRHNHDPATLRKYEDLVFATADFMAAYAWYDDTTHRYILGKGLIPAQEKFKAMDTYNPIFELAYWRWALGVAQQWRRRLGIDPDTAWQHVLDHLSALPRNNERYLPAESATEAYTHPEYRADHPVVLATFGFLPQTAGLDTSLMRRTFDWVWKNWDWAGAWGWDFPLTAMTATRLGLPDQAIDALLMPVQKNRYLVNGHNYQDERLRLYLPGNGGLLAAIALMCAGYDGCDRKTPGFPQDGKWRVRWEGLDRMP